jgi:hypothetical protein
MEGDSQFTIHLSYNGAGKVMMRLAACGILQLQMARPVFLIITMAKDLAEEGVTVLDHQMLGEGFELRQDAMGQLHRAYCKSTHYSQPGFLICFWLMAHGPMALLVYFKNYR